MISLIKVVCPNWAGNCRIRSFVPLMVKEANAKVAERVNPNLLFAFINLNKLESDSSTGFNGKTNGFYTVDFMTEKDKTYEPSLK